MGLTAAAAEGKDAAQVASALRTATGAGTDAAVLVMKHSALEIGLPAGTDPQTHLSAVQSAACATQSTGCVVSIDGSSGSTRRSLLEDALDAAPRNGRQRRALQSAQVTFVVETPAGVNESLSANATAVAQLTDALTASLEAAIGSSVTVLTPMVTSVVLTITVILEGSDADAQAASAPGGSMDASVVTASLASSLGVNATELTVDDASVIFPPRPPPSSPPPAPPQPPPSPPHVVRVSFTASGDVSDFDDAHKSAILAALAYAAGMSGVPSGANLAVTPASVRVEAELPVSSVAEGAAASDSLSSAMGSAASATAMFGASGIATLTVLSAVEIVHFDGTGRLARAASTCGLGSSGVCEFCSRGTYKSVYGPWDYRCDLCQPCPAGQHLFGCGGNTAGACLACQKGSYKPSAASWNTECDACPPCSPGFYRLGCGAGEVGTCHACPTGKYKDLDLNWDTRCSSCEHCPAGTHRVGCGGSSPGTCDPCPLGKYKASSPPEWWEQPCSLCLPCPAGFQLEGCSGGNPGTCVACEVGKYKPDHAAWDTMCQPVLPCPAGAYRLGAYADFSGTCATCESGFYKPDEAQWNTTCTACESCGPGTYRTFCGGPSAGRCSDCPHGMNKPETHPGACVACEQCSPGYVLN